MVNVAILGAGFMGSAHAANYRALEGRVARAPQSNAAKTRS